jgi:chromosomal replication initiation ATPase DnaA
VNEAAQLWTECAEVIRGGVKDAVWKTWFDGLEPVSIDHDSFTLSAPSSIVRDRLDERFSALIEHTLSTVSSRSLKVDIVVRKSAEADMSLFDVADLDIPTPASPPAQEASHRRSAQAKAVQVPSQQPSASSWGSTKSTAGPSWPTPTTPPCPRRSPRT